MGQLNEKTILEHGFEAPEGPIPRNGGKQLLWYFVHQAKPWLGIEVYYKVSERSDKIFVMKTIAINYGTHHIVDVDSDGDLDLFLWTEGKIPALSH